MRTINIGRSPENEIVMSDTTVSRNHASLIIKNDEYWIKDLDSSNGTYINGNRIYGEHPLGRHDILKVGSVLVPWMNYTGEFKNSHQATTEIKSEERKQDPEPYVKPNYGLLILPGAGTSLTLGILSIVLASAIGLILGIIGITQANKALYLCSLDPGKYNEKSISNAKAGRVCSIIGIVLSSLVLLIIISRFNA